MKVKSRQAVVGDWIFVLVCVIVSLLCVLPMVNLLAKSLSGSYAFVRNEVYFLPKGLNFDAYVQVFQNSK